MEDPTFRLEGVVRVRDDLEDFEGPLTLILQLLSKNKIEIEDISISSLTDQYLEYLDGMKSMDLEVASEFVAMASYLVYLKTKMLLSVGDEEVSELDQLISTLESMKSRDTYLQIQQTVEPLQEMYRRGFTFVKQPEPVKTDGAYRYSHEPADLTAALRRVFESGAGVKIVPPGRPFFVPKRIVYSVSAKSAEILTLLMKKGITKLQRLFGAAGSRSELVATFIAVLELCKDGRVQLTGAADDPIIGKTETGAAQEEPEEETVEKTFSKS